MHAATSSQCGSVHGPVATATSRVQSALVLEMGQVKGVSMRRALLNELRGTDMSHIAVEREGADTSGGGEKREGDAKVTHRNMVDKCLGKRRVWSGATTLDLDLFSNLNHNIAPLPRHSSPLTWDVGYPQYGDDDGVRGVGMQGRPGSRRPTSLIDTACRPQNHSPPPTPLLALPPCTLNALSYAPQLCPLPCHYDEAAQLSTLASQAAATCHHQLSPIALLPPPAHADSVKGLCVLPRHHRGSTHGLVAESASYDGARQQTKTPDAERQMTMNNDEGAQQDAG
ncbi:hypothetical protein BDN70DRAFT_901009 [Pholiota conissans]|uniref:Uncharacterized protein n=1 Tax=Pholiota conissans TaxID=109636 RepID=A0A9P6CTQ6_9AGAR|nr:hypothetical protein BDN70DRAFT_901009 [Pholiota conissans]